MIRKNLTILMLVGYYLAGTTVAAWLVEQGHVDAKLSLLVLPLMYLAHLGFNAIAGNRGRTEACRCCHGDIGLFRRLACHRFCSDEHEHRYFAEMDQLGIERLRAARPASPAGSPVEFAQAHVNSTNREVQAPIPNDQHQRTLDLMVRPAAAFRPSAA